MKINKLICAVGTLCICGVMLAFPSKSSFAAAAIAYDKTENLYYSCTSGDLNDAKKCAADFCRVKSTRSCEIPLWSSESKGWNALALSDRGSIVSWGAETESVAKIDAISKCLNKYPTSRCSIELAFIDKSDKLPQNNTPKKPLPPLNRPHNDGLLPDISSQGTGFVINSDGFIITNNHVINGKTHCYYLPDNQSKGSVRIIRRDEIIDIAVLKADRSFLKFARLSALDPLKGQEVYAVGYPLQDMLASQQIITSGLVSATAGMNDDASRIQHSAPTQPGNSGGPLFNRAGGIAGVNVAVLKSDALMRNKGIVAQNINFAIKPSSVKKFLDAYSIKYSTSDNTAQVDPETLAKAAEDFVIKIECFN